MTDNAPPQRNYILSPSQIAEIVWLYDQQKLSPYKIAKLRNPVTGELRFPVSHITIRYHLKRQAEDGTIQIRNRSEAIRKHVLDLPTLKKMYLLPPAGKGMSIYAIAKELSTPNKTLSPGTIYTTLRDAGIPIRSYEEAKELERARRAEP